MNICVGKKGLGLFVCALIFTGSLGAMEGGLASGGAERRGCVAAPEYWGLPEEGLLITPGKVDSFLGQGRGNLNKDMIALCVSEEKRTFLLKFVHYAAFLGCINVEVYKKIKDCGGDIDCRFGEGIYKGLTALGFAAVVIGNCDVARALLEVGADPDIDYVFGLHGHSIRGEISRYVVALPMDPRAEAWRRIKELFDAVPCEAQGAAAEAAAAE
jgi:hypothetical protein